MKKVPAVILFALLAAALPAEDIRVIVPYVGVVSDAYKDTSRRLDLDGSGLMEGLYFQWINPDRFQANAFLYYAADVLDAPVMGGHVVADFYPLKTPFGKAAVGAGVDVLQPAASTSFVSPPPPTTITVDVTPTIYAPYARIGHYFYLGSPSLLSVSVFPWVGLEYDMVQGKVDFDPERPAFGIVDQDISDETLYGLAGLSVDVTFMRFVQLQVKYKANFNADDYLSTWDALFNVFFTRHWGVSYRFKYMENPNGPMSYHLGGIAYVF